MSLAASTLFAQHTLEQIWETDSTTLKNPESVLFDEKSNSLYVSNMGAGIIVRLGLDGKILQTDRITVLHPIRALAWTKDYYSFGSPGFMFNEVSVLFVNLEHLRISLSEDF